MRVAVVGATGAVGSTMLGVLRERSFPADEVVPFAYERSAGRKIDWGEQDLVVQALSPESIQGFDIALFSAGGATSEAWAQQFADAGAVVVDNSSFWRMDEHVPLVVSEVNPEALDGHKGIVANPNCSTMQMVVALKPILDAVGIERLVISTYQSVSGTGRYQARRPLGADRAAGRGEDDVEALDRVLAQRSAGDGRAVPLQLAAGRAGRGEGNDLGEREFAIGEQLEDRRPDQSGRAHDSDSVSVACHRPIMNGG